MFPEHPPTRVPSTAPPASPPPPPPPPPPPFRAAASTARSRTPAPRPATRHPAQRARKAIAIGAAVTGIGLVGTFAVTTDVGASGNPTSGNVPTSPTLGPGDSGPFANPPDRLPEPDDSFGSTNTWSTPAVPSAPSRQPSTHSRGS